MTTIPRLALSLLALSLLSLPGFAQAKDWQIDGAHTHAGFKVKHLAVSTVRGHFGKVEGKVSYDPANLAATTATVTIDVKSIDTDNGKRDDHLRSPDFFNVAKFPTLTFTSTKVQNIGEDGSFELVGDLTMKDVTKEITLKVEGFTKEQANPFAPGQVKVGTSATAKLNRQDWNINWKASNKAGELVVSDDVTLIIDVELNGK